MHARSTSGRSSTMRGNRALRAAATLAVIGLSLAAPATAAEREWGATRVVSGGEDTLSPTGTTLFDIYQFRQTEIASWVWYENWDPQALPDTNDTVLFDSTSSISVGGTVYGPATARSRQDRRIGALRFDTGTRVADDNTISLDFGGVGNGDLNSLRLTQGSLEFQSAANTNFHPDGEAFLQDGGIVLINANVVNEVAGVWKFGYGQLAGRSLTVVNGSIITPNSFTITSGFSSELEVNGSTVVSGPLSMTGLTARLNALSATGLHLDDADLTLSSSAPMATPHLANGSKLRLKGDFAVTNTLSLQGTELEVASAAAGGRLVFGSATGVIAGTIGTPTSAAVNVPLVAQNLVVRNTHLTIGGAASAANSVGSTLLETGSITLERDHAGLLGSHVTVGTSQVVAPVLLTQTMNNQLGAGATLVLNRSAEYRLRADQSVGQLVLAGGTVVVDTRSGEGGGAGVLTMGSSPTIASSPAGSGYSTHTIRTAAGTAAAVSFGGGSHTFEVSPGNTLILDSTLVNGTGVLAAGGTLRVSGLQGNSAAIVAANGVVELAKPAGIVAATAVTVGSDAAPSASPIVRWTADDQLADLSLLTVRRGTLDLNGRSERVAGIAASGGSITTGAGGKLALTGDSTFDAAAQTLQLNGHFVLAKQFPSWSVAANTVVQVDGVLANDVGTEAIILKSGAGTLHVRGDAPNTISDIAVRAGSLELSKTPGVNAVARALAIGNNTTTGGPLAILSRSHQLPDAATLYFNGSGTFELDGFNETIGQVQTESVAAGTIRTSGGTLTLAGSQTNVLAGGLDFTGTLDLAGGSRTFEVAKSSTWNGTLSNGTLRKTGSGTLTLTTVNGNATLHPEGGVVAIGTATVGGLAGNALGNVQISNALTANISSASSTTFSGTIYGSGKLTKTGAGTLVLATGANSLAGGVELLNGTLELRHTSALGAAAPRLGNFASVVSSVAGRSAIRFTHGANTVGQFSNIRLDDDGLIVDYSGSASPFSSYRDLAAMARNNGAWTGSGLGSILATEDPLDIGVGIVEASGIFSGNGPWTWRGKSVDATTLLAAATLLGDTNLDLSVNFDDLLALSQNYGATSGKSWVHGDANYDNAVNFDDLLALAQHYNGSLLADGAAITSGGAAFAADLALAQSLVPEPGSLSLLAMAGLARRRRLPNR